MSEHVDQGAYFHYGDFIPARSSSQQVRATEQGGHPSSEWNAVGVSWIERAMQHARLREELRAEHRGLTEGQLDAIAAMTVELRLVRVRLGSARATVLTATHSDGDAHD